MSSDEDRRYSVILRELEVVEISDLSPRMRRITFGGAQLGARQDGDQILPAFESFGPDDHVKLFFPDPKTGVTTLPERVDHWLRWPDNPPAISRDYTPRGFDPAARRLAIDFVLHGNGIGDAWAANAQPGQRIHMGGPRASMRLPRAPRYLLIGDETALPAIANWLEQLPADVPVAAHILTLSDDARQPLPAAGRAAIRWHRHDPADPKAMVTPLHGYGIGQGTYVWAAGERAAVARLRSHLDEMNLDPGLIDLSTYWTRGKAQPN